ncbi:hypothetical protein GCM10027199_78710 [Amycolatopsis magusensis]
MPYQSPGAATVAPGMAPGEPGSKGAVPRRATKAAQLQRCAGAWRAPDMDRVTQTRGYGAVGTVDLTDRAIMVSGLDEPPRYAIQNRFGFQVHDPELSAAEVTGR